MNNEKPIDSIEQNSESIEKFFDNLTWLSTKDAAVYLRKFRKKDGKPSDGAIRTAIWRGLLKARKWGRRLYIKRVELDRLLELSLI
ncbi:MAG: helix-turn-helix domain-containing protein [Deltaproteobacteria bacterium]|nr:helix-turn-helix domain-containing protein [Deltaproteobacteria bacterium]